MKSMLKRQAVLNEQYFEMFLRLDEKYQEDPNYYYKRGSFDYVRERFSTLIDRVLQEEEQRCFFNWCIDNNLYSSKYFDKIYSEEEFEDVISQDPNLQHACDLYIDKTSSDEIYNITGYKLKDMIPTTFIVRVDSHYYRGIQTDLASDSGMQEFINDCKSGPIFSKIFDFVINGNSQDVPECILELFDSYNQYLVFQEARKEEDPDSTAIETYENINGPMKV